MQYSALVILLTSCAFTTQAHWNYNQIIVNHEIIGSPYQYIRITNNSNNPLENINSTDMRCNSVTAGDTLGFAISDTFGHPGPQQVYLSKAPGSAADYDGSGDWAKIYTLTYSLNASEGASDGVLKWATYRARTFNFALPSELPAAEYLVRAEGLALHAAHKPDKAQFYVGCAQIKVLGSGTGVPGPTIRFPGGYRWNSVGVLIPEFWSRIMTYTAPGLVLWPEGTREAHMLDGRKKVGAD